MTPAVDRVGAVEWEALFNASAGTVLLHLKGVASFARLTFPLTGPPPPDVMTKTPVTNAHSVPTWGIFKAPLVSRRMAQDLAGVRIQAAAVIAIVVVKMELALPIARIAKPVTRPM